MTSPHKLGLGNQGHLSQWRSPTDVLVGFALFDQLREAALHDTGRPFVHLALAVVGASDDVFDTLLQKPQIKRAWAVMWESPGCVSPEEFVCSFHGNSNQTLMTVN